MVLDKQVLPSVVCNLCINMDTLAVTSNSPLPPFHPRRNDSNLIGEILFTFDKVVFTIHLNLRHWFLFRICRCLGYSDHKIFPIRLMDFWPTHCMSMQKDFPYKKHYFNFMKVIFHPIAWSVQKVLELFFHNFFFGHACN
jgi:hypothetical protein